MPVYGDFHRRRQHSAPTVHRALPVCGWPALGISWGTVRSNAAFALLRKFGGACTGGCGRAEHVVCGDCCAVFLVCRDFQRTGSIRQPQCTEPCQCVGDQPWASCGALQGQMQPLQCEVGMEGPALGAAAWPGGWFSGVAFWPVCGDFQRRRQHSATTAHRALPVCEWPVLGMPRDTARSNAASAVCSRFGGGACTECCGRAGQMVCEGVWFC